MVPLFVSVFQSGYFTVKGVFYIRILCDADNVMDGVLYKRQLFLSVISIRRRRCPA